MSDTPRTDGAVFVVFSSPSNDVEAVDADFARELERENAALLNLVEDMARQYFYTGVVPVDYNGQVAGSMVTDSGALSVNGEVLRRLAQTNPSRFRIVAEEGRMVVGYWPENDPKKEEQL